MTNIAHILETALLVLVAYLFGCVIGYAARRILFVARQARQVAAPIVSTQPLAAIPETAPGPARPRRPAARLAATASEEPPPVLAPPVGKSTTNPRKPKTKFTPSPEDPRPSVLAGPRNGQADNLKQIKGIGPKIETLLNALGIYHLDQIAGWSNSNVDWIEGHLAFKGRIRREHWVEQAGQLTTHGA